MASSVCSRYDAKQKINEELPKVQAKVKGKDKVVDTSIQGEKELLDQHKQPIDVVIWEIIKRKVDLPLKPPQPLQKKKKLV